jgi:nitroreductase
VLDPATSLSDIIHNRHSARAPYDPSRPLPEADLESILEAARWAPTAHNMQNYEFIVVDDASTLTAIGRIQSGGSAEFVRENYAQLSFTEEELIRKGTGVLATMFPPSCAGLTPSRSRTVSGGRWTRPWAPARRLSSSSTTPAGDPGIRGRLPRHHEPGMRHAEHVADRACAGSGDADHERLQLRRRRG